MLLTVGSAGLKILRIRIFVSEADTQMIEAGLGADEWLGSTAGQEMKRRSAPQDRRLVAAGAPQQATVKQITGISKYFLQVT